MENYTGELCEESLLWSHRTTRFSSIKVRKKIGKLKPEKYQNYKMTMDYIMDYGHKLAVESRFGLDIWEFAVKSSMQSMA